MNTKIKLFLCTIYPLCLLIDYSEAILYPIESETRELKSLDGIWKFQLSPSLEPEIGFEGKWFSNKSVWLQSDKSKDKIFFCFVCYKNLK